MLPPHARALLHVDSAAGLAVGVVVLALSRWLAALYELPLDLVQAMGVANLAYGAGSGNLVWRLRRTGTVPRLAVTTLAVANLAWAAVCVALIVGFAGRSNAVGVAVLILEAAFVGGIGLAELRWVRPHTR